MNNTASVLLISKVTLLIRPPLTANSLTFVKVFSIPLTIFPKARKPISSANDKAVISGFFCSILSNIPLKQILNKIGDIDKPYGTSAQIFVVDR